MNSHDNNSHTACLKGAVYGDIIGAPYMTENTSNRYFDIGEPNMSTGGGRLRKCFAECTEASLSCLAVSRWLQGGTDRLSVEGLRRELGQVYRRHPRASWSEQTRLYLSSGDSTPSRTADWMAALRAVPAAMYAGSDLGSCLDIAEMAVRATCDSDEAAMTGRMLAHAAYSAQTPTGAAALRTMLETQYSLALSRPEEDLRAELRGAKRQPLVIMGQHVEGGYWYPEPDGKAVPGCGVVAEAALRAVVNSDCWEDAVRRAVALGGPSNAVASIAGALAETVYGQVTPSVEGRLYSRLPIDIAQHFSELDRAASMPTGRRHLHPASAVSDAVTIIGLGPGNTVFVVPEERADIREVITDSFPSPRMITPESMDEFLERYRESRSGTYVYGTVPEVRTLYLQDGRLVSPSQYAAEGMPSLQERKKHLEEFLRLRNWCADRQREMNAKAGNADAGQVHYGNAYHMWIGSRRIDFRIGDLSAGRILLDDRGLLRVEMGEMRSIGADARFGGHAEQAWASREIFSRWDVISPLAHLEDMRSEISYALLDEGKGCELHEVDSRYLDGEELTERMGVSNLGKLERLDGSEPAPMPSSLAEQELEAEIGNTESPAVQPVGRIYTLGYGTRSSEAFVNTLKMSGIDTVVDVRSFPRSRYAPQFNEDAIYAELEGKGISYISAAEKLGARPSAPSLYREGVAHWPSVMESEPYRSGIDALENLAEEGRMVAVVCSEGDPLSCHRFGMIARSLAEDGYDVRHIMYNGECVSQTELEDRLLQKYVRQNKISTVYSGTYSKQLEEAFSVMNSEHGHRQGDNVRYASHKQFKHYR